MPVALISGITDSTNNRHNRKDSNSRRTATAETGSNITGQQQTDPAQNRNRQKHKTDIRQQQKRKTADNSTTEKHCPVFGSAITGQHNRQQQTADPATDPAAAAQGIAIYRILLVNYEYSILIVYRSYTIYQTGQKTSSLDLAGQNLKNCTL